MERKKQVQLKPRANQKVNLNLRLKKLSKKIRRLRNLLLASHQPQKNNLQDQLLGNLYLHLENNLNRHRLRIHLYKEDYSVHF